MYKNIIRGVINKKTGHALTISHGIAFTYDHKNNTRSQRGVINLDCRSTPVKVIIKEYLK